jgi:hypothetical protein
MRHELDSCVSANFGERHTWQDSWRSEEALQVRYDE